MNSSLYLCTYAESAGAECLYAVKRGQDPSADRTTPTLISSSLPDGMLPSDSSSLEESESAVLSPIVPGSSADCTFSRAVPGLCENAVQPRQGSTAADVLMQENKDLKVLVSELQSKIAGMEGTLNQRETTIEEMDEELERQQKQKCLAMESMNELWSQLQVHARINSAWAGNHWRMAFVHAGKEQRDRSASQPA